MRCNETFRAQGRDVPLNGRTDGRFGTIQARHWVLVLILSANFGVVVIDRTAVNYLMPFIRREMNIGVIQIGLLAGGLAATWALSGLLVGRISDHTGKRKALLLLCTIGFSLCSMASGLVYSFASLFVARLLMGIAEGGIMPLSQALISEEVDASQRGFAMGVTQNLGTGLLGNFVGPLMLVAVASAWGWRYALISAAAPGLLTAALIYFLVQDPDGLGLVSARSHPSPVSAALSNRNLRTCILLSVLCLAYFVVIVAFGPLMLVEDRGLNSARMSWIMGSFGLGTVLWTLLATALSDRIGRRPVVIGMLLLGLAAPGACLFSNDFHVILVGFVVGSAINAALPLCMSAIPSESVAPDLLATALGLTMGFSEIVGGVLSPLMAGVVADQFGIHQVSWLMLAFCLCGAATALMLRETAPAVSIGRTV